MGEWATYIFSGLAALSALYILFTSNLLYAAFSLVLTFLSVAILYFIAGADFIGATQIMIYVGGIIVIIIFGVMLTNRLGDKVTSQAHNKFLAFVLCGSLFAIFITAILEMNLHALSHSNYETSELGKQLMTTYLLPFELAGVLLLVALIGAAVIAGGKERQSI